jgi:uncharacterized repeat protein (TIGR01451 family)
VKASQISPSTVPIGAVIYGGINDNHLINETGSASAPDIGDLSADYSIQRISGPREWESNSTPNPGSSPYFPEGPDLSIQKSHSGNFTVGSPEIYTISIDNFGSAPATEPITVTDALPTGLNYISVNFPSTHSQLGLVFGG